MQLRVVIDPRGIPVSRIPGRAEVPKLSGCHFLAPLEDLLRGRGEGNDDDIPVLGVLAGDTPTPERQVQVFPTHRQNVFTSCPRQQQQESVTGCLTFDFSQRREEVRDLVSLQEPVSL